MKFFSTRYARIVLALVVALLLIAAITGSASAAAPTYHTVQHGQTLTWIAGYYGVSVWALACANGLYNPNYIYAGMVLYIPYSGYGNNCHPTYHPPSYPQPCQCYPQYHPPSYPRPCPCYSHPDCYYTVRWGDNLYQIALRFGTSWVTLAYANGLHNGNYVYAGQVLRIPGCN